LLPKEHEENHWETKSSIIDVEEEQTCIQNGIFVLQNTY